METRTLDFILLTLVSPEHPIYVLALAAQTSEQPEKP